MERRFYHLKLLKLRSYMELMIRRQMGLREEEESERRSDNK